MSGDPYWNYVHLLCRFEGPDLGKRFVDERHNLITANGDAKLSTVTHAPITGSNSSAVFDGTGDYLSLGGPSYTLGNLAALNFTVEYWIKPTSLATAGIHFAKIVSAGTLCFYLVSTTAGGLNFKYFPTGGIASAVSVDTPSGVLTAGVWSHVAVCREGATLRIFVNGVLVVASNMGATAIYSNSAEFTIGGNPTYPSNLLNGYLDDFRLTVGVARYTSDFTPPTEQLPNYDASGPRTDQHYGNVVLHCHFDGEHNGTTFVDQKGHLMTPSAINGVLPATITTDGRFGGSCAYATGFTQNQQLRLNSTDFVLGTKNFTLEFWHKSLSTSIGADNYVLFYFTNNAGTSEALKVYLDSLSRVNVKLNGVLVAGPTSLTNVTTNWYHIALVRNGNTLALFANGLVVGVPYIIGSNGITNNGELFIFDTPYGGTANEVAYSRIDEARLTESVARYTANFTPPAEPFPDFALQKLSGTVFDADSNPVAKTVRSYRSSDGMFVDQTVSNAITGAFELRATDTTEHFVVVHDTTKNALVYDHIVPVI